jgi:DNA-binding winged helix-turn-helix (wHTH) protein/TolB-like protein
MSEHASVSEQSGRVDLSKVPEFQIGALTVRPSRCEVGNSGRHETLQPRVMQVFVALARADGQVVSRDELVEACWRGLHVADDSISRCIIRLRRLGEDSGAFSIETVTRVGYRLAAGPAPDAAAPMRDALEPRAKARAPAYLNVLVGVGVGTAATALAAFALWPGHGVVPALAPAPSRLSVLPFESLTGSPAEGAFATGLADELQGVLSAGQISLVPREDAQTLRGAGMAARLEKLGVRLLIDGTVAMDGDVLRARVHLDDPTRRLTLWSAELSDRASDPNALEAQVGARTAVVLNCAGPALRPVGGLSDPGALRSYLQACELIETGIGSNASPAVYSAVDALRQVTVRAPGFAPGHSALAWLLARFKQAPALPSAAAEAEREARRALAIDPKDSEAYLALSLLRPLSDYVGREKLVDQALAANPSSAYANFEKGNLLLGVGRFAEGVASIERASAANPLSLTMTPDIVHVAGGHTALGNTELERLQRLWPHSTIVWWHRVSIYLMEQRIDDVLKLIGDPAAGFDDTSLRRLRTALLAAQAPTPAAVAEVRQQMLTDPAVNASDYAVRVGTLASMGLTDDAFRLADRWARAPQDDYSGTRYLFPPRGAGELQRDPRFIALAAKLGLVDYWRATGKWPDFCAEPGLPYDCKAEAAKAVVASRTPRSPG